jgi:tryptophan-rich sensory protein
MDILLIGFSGALLAALLTPSYVERESLRGTGKEWYQKYIQDNVNIAPPSLVFPIVWSLLYAGMAVSIGLWAGKPELEMQGGIYLAAWILIILNIVLNKLWTLIFFSFRDKRWSIPMAFVDALLIFGTAVAVVVLFHLGSSVSVWVFILWYAYVLWTGFATVLSLAILLCNMEDGLGISYEPMELE